MDNREPISIDKPHNSEMGGLITGLVLCALGLCLMLFPMVAEVDRMGFGYALITFGVFILIAGLVTTWMFGVRAAELNKLLAGEGLLAHWTYPQERFFKNLEKLRAERLATNRSLLLVVAFFIVACSVLFSILFYLEEGEISGSFLAIMFGVLGLCAIFAFVMPGVSYRNALKNRPEARITERGLLLYGEYHLWGKLGNRLTKVEFKPGPGGASLNFSIRYWSRVSLTLTETHVVKVPVPPGKESEAQDIAAHFHG